jgi:hypothetical protein
MNVGIGIVAAQFLFWEYLFRIFGIVSLQCAAVFGLQRFTYCSIICQIQNRPLDLLMKKHKPMDRIPKQSGG